MQDGRDRVAGTGTDARNQVPWIHIGLIGLILKPGREFT